MKREAIAGLLAVALLRPYGFAQTLQPGQLPATPRAQPGQPKQPGQPAVEDLGWPRQVSKDGAVLIYYQPQIDEWKDYKQLTGKMAFALTPKGGKQVLGVADLKAGTLVDKDTRTVFFRDITATDVRFPSLDANAEKPMEDLFRSLMPTSGEPISVDRVLADLERSKVDAKPVEVNNAPPQIFYSASPAVVLMVQGEPVLAPIEKTDLQFVVNTNWDLFFEKGSKRYYLLVDRNWFTAQELKGPWSPTQKLPKDMAKLPAGQNFDDVKKVVPPPPPSGAIPQIFFSSTPAELILLKGAPVYSRIKGTHLLYVANTENDLFLDDAQQQYYVLLSGRWFGSKAFTGPWNYAGNDLPGDFAKIPSDSTKARVLASVPGTVEASDAVMLAQIPQTAIVNKADAEAKVNQQGVHYSGPPQFKPIEPTSLQYAENTQDKVIKDGDLYYLCFQGVWFMSTTSNGPWKTADSVPEEIYDIPPSSPVYNVTYVIQTNPTTTTVESSTTAGYFGMFTIGMTTGFAIAYGTGWYYPPYYYWGPGMVYPYYCPWPATYGAGYVFNPWTGGFAAGRAVYGPYGAAGGAAWYNPATGRYGRSASVQGWYGGRTVASSYNPWTGGYGATAQSHNAYSQWGQSVAARGDDWVRTGHVTTDRGTAFGYQGSGGQGGGFHGSNGTLARTNNYTYAGNDGNVYRKDNAGNWSQYSNGNWNSVDTTAAKQQAQQRMDTARQNNPSYQQNSGQARQSIQPQTWQGLNNSDAARSRGQAQTQRFQSFQRGGGGRFRR
jgi:hypothetical protein